MWDNYFNVLILMNKLYWCNFFEQFNDDNSNICINCDEPVYKYWDNSYGGYRGKCPACDINWPES